MIGMKLKTERSKEIKYGSLARLLSAGPVTQRRAPGYSAQPEGPLLSGCQTQYIIVPEIEQALIRFPGHLSGLPVLSFSRVL
eukprot:449464-Hanusia_phi.AAC.1